MKMVNKVEIRIDNFEKCHVISDQDCPLGQIYDYACAFKSLIFQKIKECEDQKQSEVNIEPIEKDVKINEQ